MMKMFGPKGTWSLLKGPGPFCGAGFTLVEMLTASVIFTILALALSTVFSAAMQISHRLSSERTHEEVAMALADMVERRERARPFSLLNISEIGSNEWIFAGLIADKSGVRKIGQVRFWVDSEGNLLREEKIFPKIGADEEGRTVELAKHVEKLEAKELFFNPASNKFESDPALGTFSKDIEPTPDVIEVSLSYKSPGGKTRRLEQLLYA